MKPQELVEAILASAKTEAIVRVSTSRGLNLRWANSTTTTNGATSELAVSIAAIDDGRVGSLARNLSGDEDPEALMRQAEKAASGNPEAEDRMELPAGSGSLPEDWDAAPVDAEPSLFAPMVGKLDQVFEDSRSSQTPTFGYAEHDESTVWFGTTAGIRKRGSISRGQISFTTKQGSRSTWGGEWVSDWSATDPVAMYRTMVDRLDSSKEHIDLPAGRYEVLLSPSAVADVFTYFLWLASLRDALDGQSPFSKQGGGTRLGEKLTEVPVTISSDPEAPGLQGLPFASSITSSAFNSVFDAGLEIGKVDYVREGELVNLAAPRAVASRIDGQMVPFPQNLLMEGRGPSLEQMIASTERGLLLNALWYIRLVDPRAMLLTGLTRDGVYLIENGRIKGEVNNFRWNVSPLDVLRNIKEVGRSANTLPREFENQLAATPPLRVSDWNMSSVSEAT